VRQNFEDWEKCQKRMLFVTDSIQTESEYLNKETHEGFGEFKIGVQVIHTVKQADKLVLMA
jgi:hypothetical protein